MYRQSEAEFISAEGRRLPSLRSIAKHQERLAAILAMIAGALDAYGILTYHIYLSFMSGNTTQTGYLLGQGKWAAVLLPALAIVFFVCGCMAGALLAHSAVRRKTQLTYAIVSVTLVLIIGLTRSGIVYAEVHIAAISFAMGVMNTALSQVGAQSVNLTFVTGTLSRLGMHLALAIKQVPLSDCEGPWDTHISRALTLATIWTGFLVGAVLSGAATPHFGVWILLAPLFTLLVLTILDQMKGALRDSQEQ